LVNERGEERDLSQDVHGLPQGVDMAYKKQETIAVVHEDREQSKRYMEKEGVAL